MQTLYRWFSNFFVISWFPVVGLFILFEFDSYIHAGGEGASMYFAIPFMIVALFILFSGSYWYFWCGLVYEKKWARKFLTSNAKGILRLVELDPIQEDEYPKSNRIWDSDNKHWNICTTLSELRYKLRHYDTETSIEFKKEVIEIYHKHIKLPISLFDYIVIRNTIIPHPYHTKLSYAEYIEQWRMTSLMDKIKS